MADYYGTDSNNYFLGTNGNDWMFGYGGRDTLGGMGGDDFLFGGAGNDRIVGGDGFDTIYFAGNVGVVVDLDTGIGRNGEAEGDTYEGIEGVNGTLYADRISGSARQESLYGSGGNDFLSGKGGRDSLNGGDGDDFLEGGAGVDSLNGGAGRDTAYYHDSDAGVRVFLSNGQAHGGHAEGDTLVDIERLVGSSFADVLQGNGGANDIYGGAGNDVLYGFGGQDVLVGEAGADRFRFHSVTESTALARDRILDFSRAEGDTIDLSAIDANAHYGGNQAFSWGGYGQVQMAGKLSYWHSGGNTYVQGDVSDGPFFDIPISIVLNGIHNLTASDFIL